MTINVKVYSIGADGIGRKYQTVSRIARDYKRFDIKETARIRLNGRVVKAEKYDHTVWTAEVKADV